VTQSNANSEPGFNDNENPLLRLFLRKGRKGETFIDAEQFAAGEKLRRDFERAMLAPRVTPAYEEGAGKGGHHVRISDNHIARLSDSALVARDRVHAALDNVGPELAGILYAVVCLASGLEHAERRLALPTRSGKAVLALALTRLARHYGIKVRTRGYLSLTSKPWHLPDYRPTIPPPMLPGHQP
jgi:Domain of unknown function (DUF6456)